MGKYTVIADVGQELVNCLVRELVPELIPDANGIGLRSPAEKGDVSLGIHLYDIRESAEIRESGMVSASLETQNFPPAYLSLYYMITAYSGSDVKFRSLQEQRILGKAMQVLHDNPLIPAHEIGQNLAGLDLRIQFLDLSMEEKLQIWGSGSSYQTSLFYRISPVELESSKTRRVSRVKEIKIGIKE